MTPTRSYRWSEDAEASVLGAVLLKPDCLPTLQLDPGDFFSLPHRAVFAAMRALAHRDPPVAIDTVTIEEQLVQAGKLQAVGGLSFLSGLTAIVPTADNVQHYAAIVRRLAEERDLRERVGHLAAFEDASELAARARELADVAARAAEPRARAPLYGVPMADLLSGGEEEDMESMRDWIIRGVVPAAMPSAFCGEPKTSKTLIAEHLAVCVAAGISPWLEQEAMPLRSGRVLMLLLEDHVKQTRRRLRKLAWGLNVDPAELENLRVEPNTSRFLIDDVDDRDRMRRTLDAWRPDWLVLDSLTRVHQQDEANPQALHRHVLRHWEDICRDYSCAVTAVHHESKPGNKPAAARARGGNRMRGSVALFAFIRHLVSVEKQSETDMCLEVDGNLLYRPEPFVVRKVEGAHANGKATTRLAWVGPKSAAGRALLKDALAKALAVEPADGTDLAKALKRRKSEVLKALREMQDDKVVAYDPDTRQWRMRT